MDGTVNRDDAGIFFHQAFDADSAAMRGSVVHDPEHAPGLAVGRLGHHLGHQPVKRNDPGLSLAPAEELCPKNVERREVRPGAAPPVFVFDPHCLPRSWRKGGMPSCAGLNGGLLVRGQNELVVFERFPLKDPLVEVEDARGFGRKERIAGKNPTSVLPGLDRILGKPAPDGAVADTSHQPGAPCLGRHVGRAHPGERNPQVGGQFTRQGLDVDDELRGEKPAGGRGAGVLLKPRQALLEESLPPFPDDLPANIQEGCDLIGGESLGRQEDHLGPQDMIIRRRIFHRTPHQLASLFRRQDDPVWAFSRLGDGPPSLSPCHGPAYVASHNTSPYL